MIYSARIKKTLNFIEAEYQKHLIRSDKNIPIMFAKLGVLEYCGWLELSFDEVARNAIRNHVRNKSDKTLLEKKIKSIHGFDYNHHVRSLLCHAIGVEALIKVENRLNRLGNLDKLRSNLESIASARNEAAHTFTSGRTSRFQAPSLTLRNLNESEPIILMLWEEVAK